MRALRYPITGADTWRRWLAQLAGAFHDVGEVWCPSSSIGGRRLSDGRTSNARTRNRRIGRLVVGDRGNNRLQILDLDGNYIEEFKAFSRPSGIYITGDDTIFVADSESAFDEVRAPGWTPGIRVGSLRDGQPMYLITGNVEAYPNGSNPEGVAVDAAGNVYGAVVSEGGAFLKSVGQ